MTEYAHWSFHQCWKELLLPPESRFQKWYDWASGANGSYGRPYWHVVDEARQVHERALAALDQATTTGRGFVLFLRDFPEEDLYDDKGLAPELGLELAMWLKSLNARGGRWTFLYDLAQIAGPDRPVVTIGNPWSFLPTGHKDTGVHHIFVADWMAAVQILIQKAELIIVYGGRSGDSMRFELSEILRMGMEKRTVMFSRPKEESPYDRFPEVDHSTLMKMFGREADFFDNSSTYDLKAFDNRERYTRPSIEIGHLVTEWIRTAFQDRQSLERS